MANKIKTLFKIIRTVKNFHVYPLDYFGIAKRRVTYHLRNGTKYIMRAGSTDRFIFNEILLHNSYNPKGFEIQEKDVVVDIGAHIGIFTIMASCCARNGKVYSFEPMKENFDILRENINLNGAGNIVAANKAVSSEDRVAQFFISCSKNKGQNSFSKLGENQKEVTVKSVSFKKFLTTLPRTDFLKMDCEGAEYEILFSLSEQELTKIKKISMEYHTYDKHNGNSLAEFLQKNNFKVRLIRDGERFGRIYAQRR